MPQRIRMLSGDQVRLLLPMARAIDEMTNAFTALASDQVEMPERAHLESSDGNTTVLVMPSQLHDRGLLGLKLISLCDRNHDRGLPMIQAVVLVMDMKTGQVRGMMDGASLTAIRTGAVSGLATRYLAREDSRVAAIFGAGVQGRTQLVAIVTARPSIEKAYIFDPDEEAANCFAQEMSRQLGLEVTVPTDRLPLHEADVICTATPSPKPLFQPEELGEGVHINAVGSYKLCMQEIPEALVASAKVVVDDTHACLSETADLILPIRHGLMTREDIYAQLGELTTQDLPGRTTAKETTLFKSVGLAIQDLAAAAAILQAAEEEDVGTIVEI
jgi:ornithine cyclodeaminase/alanine dehydrogenase-like protein (mu-crystallin family)